MKRIFTIFFLVCITISVYAQRPYFCVTKGAVLEMTTYDAKDKETGQSRATYVDVSGSGGNYSITISTEILADGEPIMAPIEMTANITNGLMSLSFGDSEETIDAESDVPFIPSRLAVGMELNCGVIKVNMAGITATNTILEHRVVDREELTTPAGTFKCYIVEQVYESKVFGIRVKGSSHTWYARGVGAVKTVTYDDKGKVVQTQLLTGINM